MYLLNGEIKHHIDVADRGLQYGDGLFETIEVSNHHPIFFWQHLQRLTLGCQRLQIPPPNTRQLYQEATLLIQRSTTKKSVLKLIITRGSGGRGYRFPETVSPTRLLSLHPFPDYPDIFSQQGITVRFCHTRLGLNPNLAGIKHLNRLEQILARAEWDSTTIQEGLMLDVNNHVVEGTMSNLFFVKDKILYTPNIEQSGVKGIIRDIIINLAQQSTIKVLETKISQAMLYQADEIFISNSIIGIWPINRLAEQGFKVGPITQQLQTLLLACKQQDIKNVG